jgi:hypothetical protein
MNAETQTLLDPATIKRELLVRAEQVCRHLLPAGKRHAAEWLCGNLQGEAGRSLAISLATGIWKDFATGERGGNLLELWRQVRRLDFTTALHEAAAFMGHATREAARKDDDDAAEKREKWPPFLIGDRHDHGTVANLRGVVIEGIELASERGLLRFADWRGHPCWIITDSRRLNAQARRLDGKPFTVEGQYRKAITLPGSRAGLPIGLAEAKKFAAVAVVEGGPDLLAAHGCIWAEDRTDVAVVAVLGASNRPGPATWMTLAGKRVRVYCHRDDVGMRAGQAWGRAIIMAGALKVDGFRFDGLRKVDGSPVEDLNDLLALHSDVCIASPQFRAQQASNLAKGVPAFCY